MEGDNDLAALMQAVKEAARGPARDPSMRRSNDPRHWRRRAEETLAIAASMNDAVSRRMLKDVADGYEGLARRAEERFHPQSLEKSMLTISSSARSILWLRQIFWRCYS